MNGNYSPQKTPTTPSYTWKPLLFFFLVLGNKPWSLGSYVRKFSVLLPTILNELWSPTYARKWRHFKSKWEWKRRWRRGREEERKRGYIFKAVSTSLSASEGKSTTLHSRTHCKEPRGTSRTDRGWSSGSLHLKPRLRQGLTGITGNTNSTSIEASEWGPGRQDLPPH